MSCDPLVVEFDVHCSAEHAFATWTSRIATWWPSDHTVTNANGVLVTFEGRVGGRLFERAADGSEHVWGTVLAWEPPARLAYTWHLGTSREHATVVDVSFVPSPSGTRVRIDHSGWATFGDAADARRAGNLRGWDDVLVAYRAAANANAR